MYRGEPTQGTVWDEARATTYPRPGKRKQLHAHELGKRGAANTPPPPLQAVRTASSVPLIPIVIFSESRRRNPSTTARIRAHAWRPPPHPRRAPASVSASTPAPAPGARIHARRPGRSRRRTCVRAGRRKARRCGERTKGFRRRGMQRTRRSQSASDPASSAQAHISTQRQALARVEHFHPTIFVRKITLP